MKELKNRYDFMLVFDVKDGNPNGDPDADNRPRVDHETEHGLVTDVCIKRKVRNYVQLIKGEEAGYDIFVKEGAVLNLEIDKAIKDSEDKHNAPAEAQSEGEQKGKKKKTDGKKVRVEASKSMCAKFFDVRTFGAVLNTGAKAENVKGPVAISFARSVDPVNPQYHCITRCAATKDDDKERTIGNKWTIPYGLYVATGCVTPAYAHQSGFGEEDLELLWKALADMFEFDRASARGMMSTQKLIVFKHDSALGNAHSNKLFDAVKIEKKSGVEAPRKFTDYDISIGEMPDGVTVIEKC